MLYSGAPKGLADVEESVTRRYLFDVAPVQPHAMHTHSGWLELADVTRNNLTS